MSTDFAPPNVTVAAMAAPTTPRVATPPVAVRPEAAPTAPPVETTRVAVLRA